MTYDIYRIIFIGGAILCGVMFIVSVLLFIFLNVPKLISDLSGATARKAIKNIREQNEATGDKYHKVSAFNEARGKLTDKISPSGNIQQREKSVRLGIDTTKIGTQQLSENSVGTETSVLSDETSVLSDENGVLTSGETSVLSELVAEASAGETSVLSSEDIVMSESTMGMTGELSESAHPESSFVVEFEITYIHTDEIIEAGAVG